MTGKEVVKQILENNPGLTYKQYEDLIRKTGRFSSELIINVIYHSVAKQFSLGTHSVPASIPQRDSSIETYSHSEDSNMDLGFDY